MGLLCMNLIDYNIFQNLVWLYLIQLTGRSPTCFVNLVSYWSKYYDSLQAVVLVKKITVGPILAF